MLLAIHIAAGGLAIVLGAVALSVKKGGALHRRSGLLFVGAMLVLGLSTSLFVLPWPFTTGPMRSLPILLLLGSMAYWLWRVRAGRGPVNTRLGPGVHP